MPAASPDRLPVDVRRRALGWGLVNGALWSVGNGLTTGAVVSYFAQELGASGTALSVLIAAPFLAGVFRLSAGWFIARWGSVKRTCLAFSAASYLLLAVGLPTIFVGWPGSRRTALALLIALICVHQLLEYVGAVALWSWLGGLAPRQVRGRYFGRRQMWQLVALAPALVASGQFVDAWKSRYGAVAPERILTAYTATTTLGACFLVASLVPLWRMTDVVRPRAVGPSWSVASLLAPLADGRFRRLLAYRLWFSFFNGLGQAALNIYPRAVLGLGVLPMQLLPFGMRLGQLATSPAVGTFADRRGNRPVLIASQAAVALGPLFYLLATPERRWWIVGAWIVYIAYAGTNICLPTLMLKLSPEVDNASHVAVFETLHGVAYGLSVIAGGVLFDALGRMDARWHLGPVALDRFGLMFVVGAVTRAMGIVWLARIDEPGAWTWRGIVRDWRCRRSLG